MLFVPTVPWPVEEVRAFIDAWAWRGAPPFRLAICRRDGRMIGSIGIARDGEIFYFLDPADWGRGHGREAVAAFCAAVFDRFDFAALEAEVFDDNPASARLLASCAFTRIGGGMGRSAARLEAAPVSRYRLLRPIRI